MCGIAGLYSFDQQIDKLDLVKKMTNALKHRGMDGDGHWINENKNICLGHRRLSILDLSINGKQPMHYLDNRYTITYNGEIYNYLELKKELLVHGYIFKSNCDTEVILALYDFKGEKCLDQLDGMFAFAIWDNFKQELFCARDRFGEKPFFYYHVSGESFYFASEMKALWAAGLPKELSENRIRQYLNFQFLDTEDLTSTFYKNIKQLDGAHYIKLNHLIAVEQKQYYSLDKIERNLQINEHEACKELQSMLERSVSLRLRSDVPVGSSLSGGLDSSTIVMLIDKIKGDIITQNSFSARFSGFSKDEGYYIDKVVKACGNINNFEVWPTGDQLKEELSILLYHQEEPFMSASIFAQWKVMELAKTKGVTVLLDGQGADEYMAGYLPYYDLYANQLFYNDRKLFLREVAAFNSLRAPKTLGNQITFRQRVGRLKRKLLLQELNFSDDSLISQLKRDTLVDGLKVLLRYADRNSMAHSREVRLPFLDHKIVEFVLSLPDNFLLRNGWTKWVLRESMKDILPSEIAWRVEKVGYEPPEAEWLQNIVTPNTRNRVKQYLNDKSISGDDAQLSDWNYFMLNQIIS